MKPIHDVPLHLVKDADDKMDLLRWLAFNDGQPLAIDTENEGLQPFGPTRDRVRLVQIGGVDEGWSIPFKGNERFVQEVIDTVGHHRPPFAHNAIYDQSMLQSEGIDTGPRWDCTYTAHHLLYPAEYHGLESAASMWWGRDVYALKKWLASVKRKTRTNWATVDIDHPAYWGYGALDPVLSCRLGVTMWPNLPTFQEQYDREIRGSHITAGMSRRGLRVDVAYAERLIEKWDEEADMLRAGLEKYAVASPNAGRQVSAALMNQGWEPDVYTTTGEVCTNKEVLVGLDSEIARDVLRWRRLIKWRKAYAEPLALSGGRIHPIISSLRATTGRMSVAEPPLQQLPAGPEVRNAILPEEGERMWAVDWTGQELRLLAAYAKDPELTAAVLDGSDVHGKITEALHGPDFTKAQRSATKNAVYAYTYGGGAERLSNTAHVPEGAVEEAMREAYPGIVRFAETLDNTARRRLDEGGLAWAKTMAGRRVAAPKSKLYVLRNYILQGGGADAMKGALDRFADQGVDAGAIKLVIHDECLVSAPDDGETAEKVKTLMEFDFMGVPFDAHINGPGNNWGDVA